ncbi:hypothetical protein NE235_29050 [Actinoallomurus spadix]|uniref:Uncharacterized protein n=1 Tax=Actinoallomurus spadix TaxID=79912 RepID=A0ABN0WT79_9ACTN|nr:hypothetical protein [Actinoallomurus spadix]MCO5990170.1 hypothetical protein [Actinoallomurus spadix]
MTEAAAADRRVPPAVTSREPSSGSWASPDPAWVISQRFPGLIFWFGRCTRSWWALVRTPAGWRLVEAADADELTRAVLDAHTWPWPGTT